MDLIVSVPEFSYLIPLGELVRVQLFSVHGSVAVQSTKLNRTSFH